MSCLPIIERMFGGLDTPLKRVGLTIFVSATIGVLIMSAAQFDSWYSFERNVQRVLDYWWKAATFSRKASFFSSFVFYAVVAGLMLSTFYDKTLGKLYRWIIGK